MEVPHLKFLTKVRKRRRIVQWSRWLVIGATAVAFATTWTADKSGNVTRTVAAIEKAAGPRKAPKSPVYLAVVTYITSTGAGSWSVPSGVTSVQIDGNGGGGTAAYGGGAGSAYAKSAISVTPGGTLYYNVGIGGGTSTTGATWANKAANAAPAVASNGINAPYGPSCTNRNAITAAITTGGVGDVVNYGGDGGSAPNLAGGGGGAGGPYGRGGAGGNDCNYPSGSYGSGGGGSGGGGSGTGGQAGAASGAGGNNSAGTGGGAPASGSGSLGGGGAGGTVGSANGGNGGYGADFGGAYGPGGGGGSGYGAGSLGGNGGLYGGGGGGAGGTSGTGGQGIIILTYVVNFTVAPAFSFMGIA
jgi:hypothetical protein